MRVPKRIYLDVVEGAEHVNVIDPCVRHRDVVVWSIDLNVKWYEVGWLSYGPERTCGVTLLPTERSTALGHEGHIELILAPWPKEASSRMNHWVGRLWQPYAFWHLQAECNRYTVTVVAYRAYRENLRSRWVRTRYEYERWRKRSAAGPAEDGVEDQAGAEDSASQPDGAVGRQDDHQ